MLPKKRNRRQNRIKWRYKYESPDFAGLGNFRYRPFNVIPDTVYNQVSRGIIPEGISLGGEEMPKPRENVSFRLPKGVTKERIERKIKEIEAEEKKRNVPVDIENVTDIYESALNLFLGFDPYFLLRMSGLAEHWSLPPSIVIENLAILGYAKLKADAEQHGGQMLLYNFVFDENGPIRGERLEAQCLSYTQHEAFEYTQLKQLLADKNLSERMTELNKYLSPDERPGSIKIQELERREAIAQSSNPELMEYSFKVDEILNKILCKFGTEKTREIRMKQLEIERSGDKPAALRYLQDQLDSDK